MNMITSQVICESVGYSMRHDSIMATNYCTVGGCDRTKRATGLCSKHYWQKKRVENPGTYVTKQREYDKNRFCSVDGCTKLRQAWGKCKRHADEDDSLPRCTYLGCGRTERYKGLCFTHYDHDRKGIELRPIVDWRQIPCRGPKCEANATSNNGYCPRHTAQVREYGKASVIGYRSPARKYAEDPCVVRGCTTQAEYRGRCLPHSEGVTDECWLPWCTNTGHDLLGMCDEHRARERSMRHNYGFGWKRRLEMSEECGGICSICGEQEDLTVSGGGLHVDHDHDTEKIRGLLCGLCNRGIGALRHDTERLANAIKYLENTSGGVSDIQRIP